MELRPSAIKNTVYVKSMTLGFPDEDQRNTCYQDLCRLVSTTNSDRIIILENLQLYQPQGKMSLEFGKGYFRFFGAKEFTRKGQDVVRLYLFEKTEDTYFMVIQLAQSKRINDQEMIVVELSSRHENRDLQLPADEDE